MNVLGEFNRRSNITGCYINGKRVYIFKATLISGIAIGLTVGFLIGYFM